MPIRLNTFSLWAWVVDSDGRPLPEFNLRRTAPDTVESWIMCKEGERFAIYFTGQDQSPEQKALDIHAVAQLDGRLELDGVILPSFLRADRVVGCINDQPVGEEEARRMRWSKLRIIDEEENGNDSEHTNTIRVRLEWGKYHETDTQDQFTNPTNRSTAHERAVKGGNLAATSLGKKVCSPPSQSCRFDPDDRFKPQICIFRYASQEWLKNYTSFLLSSDPQSNPSPSSAHSRDSPASDNSLVEGISISSAPPNQSERGLGPLERGLQKQPIVAPSKPKPSSVRATPSLIKRPDNMPSDKSPENQKNHSPQASFKPKPDDDRKDAAPEPTNLVQGDDTPNEPIATSNKAKTEESSDDDIVLIKHVIYYKKEKKRRGHNDTPKEGSVKKKLKSEEYAIPPLAGRTHSSRKDNRSDSLEPKIEPTD